MSHAHHHSIAHFSPGTGRLPTALLYLLPTILAVVAVYELSAGMLALLAFGFGMVLALLSRIESLLHPGVPSVKVQRGATLGDGGCLLRGMAARRTPPARVGK
jgi:hypothetical protein